MKRFSTILLFILLFSCNEERKDTNNESPEPYYDLVIVDSVKIDLLEANLIVYDVHDETKNLLIGKGNTLRLISPDGQILKEKTFVDGSPDGLENGISSAEFYKKGIALKGINTIKTYDADWKVEKVMRSYVNHVHGMIYFGFNHLMEYKGELIAYLGPHTEKRAVDSEFYQEYTVVDLVKASMAGTTTERNDSLFKSIGKLDSASAFNGKRTYFFISPKFDVTNETLYFTMDRGKYIYTWDIEKNIMLDKTPIPFDSYIQSEGLSLGKQAYKEQYEPRDRSGDIFKYFRIGDFDIVKYTSGITLEDMRQLDPESPDFQKRVMKANPYKMLISRNGKRLNKSPFTDARIGTLHCSDSEENLWASQNTSNLEEEPDFVTLYRLQVKKVD